MARISFFHSGDRYIPQNIEPRFKLCLELVARGNSREIFSIFLRVKDITSIYVDTTFYLPQMKQIPSRVSFSTINFSKRDRP